MNPHMKRWATGVIAVPILIGSIAYGPEGMFTLLIIFATLVGMTEYNTIVFGTGFRWEKAETIVVALLILIAAAVEDRALLTTVLSFAVIVILMLNLLRIDEAGLDMIRVGKVIVGIMYIPLLMSHFILMRQTPAGVHWIFFILVIAFSGDIAAYYVGSKIGKRKLLPKVSPGKTVEGTIGLVVGSIAGALLYRQFFFPVLTVPHAVILGLVGSIIGQLGDLCESALKRTAGVKDSGVMLPGHGGILDRLDCLMFIIPFVYYYRVFIIR
jgi:phosphatidate cytidylyltransferase